MFPNAAEAERAGYVACLRCHPNSLTPAEESIKAALDYIQEHIDRRITLDELSEDSIRLDVSGQPEARAIVEDLFG